MRVGGVCLTGKRAGITISDIFSRQRKFILRHQAVFHHILYFFHGNGTPHMIAFFFHIRGKGGNFFVRNFREIVHFLVRFSYGAFDFRPVENRLLTVSFDDFHLYHLPFLFAFVFSRVFPLCGVLLFPENPLPKKIHPATYSAKQFQKHNMLLRKPI